MAYIRELLAETELSPRLNGTRHVLLVEVTLPLGKNSAMWLAKIKQQTSRTKDIRGH